MKKKSPKKITYVVWIGKPSKAKLRKISKAQNYDLLFIPWDALKIATCNTECSNKTLKACLIKWIGNLAASCVIEFDDSHEGFKKD